MGAGNEAALAAVLARYSFSKSAKQVDRGWSIFTSIIIHMPACEGIKTGLPRSVLTVHFYDVTLIYISMRTR